MEIILLHSAMVEASRLLVAAFGLDPLTVVDETVQRDGYTVRIVGKHAVAVALCPNFSAYPTLVVMDGEATRVVGVSSWQDCLKAITYVPPAPQPVPTPRVITQFAFSRLFTKAERIAIRQAAKVDVDVEDFLDILDRAGEVDLDLQDTVDGVMAMEDASLIGEGRAIRILANLPPVEQE